MTHGDWMASLVNQPIREALWSEIKEQLPDVQKWPSALYGLYGVSFHKTNGGYPYLTVCFTNDETGVLVESVNSFLSDHTRESFELADPSSVDRIIDLIRKHLK